MTRPQTLREIAGMLEHCANRLPDVVAYGDDEDGEVYDIGCELADLSERLRDFSDNRYRNL